VNKKNSLKVDTDTHQPFILSIIFNYDLLHHANIKSTFLAELNNQENVTSIKLERASWDIVLLLCESFLKKETNIISDICIQSKLSESTTRRVIRKLEKIGLINRFSDETDKRRYFIELSLPYQKVINIFVEKCVDDFKELIKLTDKRERIKAQDAQHKAEMQLQTVVDAVHALISYVDKDQHYVFNNINYSNWLGYDISHLNGKHVKDILGEYNYNRVLPYINKVLSGKQVQFESELFKQDTKHPLNVQVSYTPDISETGEILGFVAHISDITHLKHIEKKISKSRRQLEMVIDATAIGIWDWLIQTGEVVFNERWTEIVGYSKKELEPMDINTWITLAHPDDLALSDKLLKQHWHGESERYVCEARMKHKQGHWVWVLDTGQVVEWYEDGKPKRMIGTHQDITQRKQAEQELKKQKNDC